MIRGFMLSDAGFAVGIACVIVLGIFALRGVTVGEKLHRQRPPAPPLFRQLREAGKKTAGRRKNAGRDRNGNGKLPS